MDHSISFGQATAPPSSLSHTFGMSPASTAFAWRSNPNDSINHNKSSPLAITSHLPLVLTPVTRRRRRSNSFDNPGQDGRGGERGEGGGMKSSRGLKKARTEDVNESTETTENPYLGQALG